MQALIVGAPGCGKTTLLKYLAFRVIGDSKRLPVFIELKTITKELFKHTRGNLAELLFEKSLGSMLHLQPKERQMLKLAFLERLAAGEAVILLDGLDELKGTGFFRQLCNSIKEFTNSAYRNNLLIISSRPYALQTGFEGLKEMEIAPLNEKQIKKFLHYHYGNHPLDQRELQVSRFLNQLRELPRVPFMLAAMVRLQRNQSSITTDRFKLYKHIVNKLASNESDRHGKHPYQMKDLGGKLKLAFLEELACDRLLVDDEEAEGEAARLIFSDELILEKARSFLRKENMLGEIKPRWFANDIEQTPFLREVGDDLYVFAHQTIQEYLAAKALSERDDCVRLFCRAYFDSTLAEKEVLPMVLGMVKKTKPDALYTLLEQLPESLSYTSLQLRARGLAYIKDRDIGDAHLERLVDRLISFICEHSIEESPYTNAVLRSFSATKGRALELILERLLSLLIPENRHRDIYTKIISALGTLGDERAVPILSKALMDGESYVRTRAAEALGKIGGRAAVRALLDASKDPITAVRGSGGDPVLWSVGNALKFLGDERAIRELIKAFNDSSNSIRESVAGVMGQIGGERALKALIAALEDEAYTIRASSASALGNIGDESAVPALCKVLLEDSYYSVRENAAFALGEIGNDRAMSALMEALHDKTLSFYSKVAVALGKIGDERPIPILAIALAGNDRERALIATEALLQIGGDLAIKYLIDALNDRNNSVWCEIATALSAMGCEQAGPILERSLYLHVDENLRNCAQKALDQLFGYHSLSTTAEPTKAEQILIRPNASEEIAKVGAKYAVARYIENLRSSDFDVRFDMAEALEKMQQKKLVNGLVNALDYHSSFVKKKAALVLGYYSISEQALELLSKMSTDERLSNDVREVARLAHSQLQYKMSCI